MMFPGMTFCRQAFERLDLAKINQKAVNLLLCVAKQ
jgi:hypothetical protein